MRTLLLFSLLLIGFSGLAQEIADSLQFYGNIMLNDPSAEQRKISGEKFGQLVDEMLRSPESFNFPDNKVRSISILESPDRRFRILTWNIPLDSGSYHFSGRMQMRSPYKVIVLNDVSYNLNKPEGKALRKGDWYGAIYYQISGPIGRKNKTYTLLGWNGHNAFSNKKLIETLQINRKGETVFGVPVIFDGKRMLHRVIFEYAEKAGMSLKFQEKNTSIIFDHLSPPQPSMEGEYAFYGPDFTYDAYRLKKGKWFFERNIDARNDDENKGRLPKAPEKGLPPSGKRKSSR